MVIAVIISLATPKSATALRVDIKNVDFRTGAGFNIAALLVVAILAVLYTVWW
jgi:SSS family solute:Na+ symporter